MRKLIVLLFLLPLCILPVNAADITAPSVPPEVESVFPDDPTSFSEGLADILRSCGQLIRPAIIDCLQCCVKIIAIVMIASICSGISGSSKNSVYLTATLCIAIILLSPANSLVNLGRDTILELTNYGKLLVPVMATGMAAQGATSGSAALYAGTVCLNTLFGSLIPGILIPLVYIYLLLGAASCAVGEELLKKLKGFVKWCVTWCLKIILYVFTGYMSITGVITGAVDASAIKAMKITISGVVPVVGGIISDASESILLSAGIMKNAAGVYGILAHISILAGPFLRIGAQYLALKITGALCQVFSCKPCTQLIQDFTGAMGLVLAMTGTACLLQLISTVCFMRGVGL